MDKNPYFFLKDTIIEKVFIPNVREKSFSPSGEEMPWLFDFRRVLMDVEALQAIIKLFKKEFEKDLPFQIGGLEVAGIPLVTALILGLYKEDKKINGFFVRKSRKKAGLLRMVEGEIKEENIILVDDLMDTGGSFIRQIEVIEGLGKKVHAVFSVLRFRDLEYYSYFHERGIKIFSLFNLDDFKDTLGLSNRIDKKTLPLPMPFKVDWYFKSENPDFFYVIPKSKPVIDDKFVYFGSDKGIFWALDQENGKVVWNYKVSFGTRGEYIFSSPALYKNLVYFGANDGNFYAIDKETGEKKWMFMEADWVRSSPCVSSDLGVVFIGLQFGWWSKSGGIVALDVMTGKKKC